MPSIEEVKKNIVDYCDNSPERQSILKAVRKARHYTDVSKTTGVNATTCSGVLKAMVPYGLVEEIGARKGIYRQTAHVRGLNIDSVIRDGLAKKTGSTRIVYKTKNVAVNFGTELKIENPALPDSILRDAAKMQKVYPYLYLFENSVRQFIMKTMEAKFGPMWWDTKVGNPIKQKASDRIKKEGRNRWHGKRGAHPIYYVDIDDLNKIINSNYPEFRDKLPDVKKPLEWVSQRIEEIEVSRNVVAHNNPLSDRDIARVKLYFKDWADQVT